MADALSETTHLRRFTAFACEMLPHEADFLLAAGHLQDPERIAILRQIAASTRSLERPVFSPAIDKRKYSDLKAWIEERLAAIDVDATIARIAATEQSLLTDSITPEQEQWLRKALKGWTPASFWFSRFYELLRHYRQYLLVRLRQGDYQRVQDFIETHQEAYRQSVAVYEQLHHITVAVTREYALEDAESQPWRDWLEAVCRNPTLDGMNRYYAAVRLMFVYTNHRQWDALAALYDYLDGLFAQGELYSRRILANYYANRLVLHAKRDELPRAAWYGRLALRHHNTDYLHYLNNLSSILLRQGQVAEAHTLMRQALNEVRQSANFHERVRFASAYVRCLNAQGRYAEADQYAEALVRGYREEVFAQRWHTFVAAWLRSLMQQEKYARVVRAVRQHKLVAREQVYAYKASYLPVIRWFYAVAQYKEGSLTLRQLEQFLADGVREAEGDSQRFRLLRLVVGELYPHIPDVLSAVKERIRG